ncbi:hypothetical protein EROM_031390 [Encephalitozoon romaleae SJ-2008]|uniref:Transmembrane protein n=1 Tax=Encephalitozoon romaleae (strain SJ-2008) TaxID=1178016 RepID=I6ZT23_ENCRO|nr:hypothetical protein EROM_031390 [Encephalitozoon romaleae SJ-2008]AFN82761.1 hypothetical protein EROM_031390 [Encephalitozoon romaleae SJ-2008]
MIILTILMSVGAYYMPSPRHAFIITTRTLSPYRLDSFPFSQVGPYKTSTDPILYSRPSRFETETSTEVGERKNSVSEEKKEGIKSGLSSIISTSMLCKLFFYTVMVVLIFFMGYQTRKCHEGGSYVRLPTSSNS